MSAALRKGLDAMTDEERAELFARWPQSVVLALTPDCAAARRIGWQIMDASDEHGAGRGLEVERVDVSVWPDVTGAPVFEATVVLRGTPNAMIPRCGECGSRFHNSGSSGCTARQKIGPDCFGGSDYA